MIQNDNVIEIDIKNYNMNKIICKTKSYKQNLYNILNYNRYYICADDYVNGKYRSVIVSNNELLTLSHPKSMSNDLFFNKYTEIDNNLWIDECIEGVMIQLFYVETTESWEIATRNSIGGDYKFYNKTTKKTNAKTFYTMFLEALGCENLQKLSFVNRKLCYNFILQHPDNTIVMPVEKPCVYLVAIYNKINNNGFVEYISPAKYQKWECFNKTSILFPKKYEGLSFDDLREKYTTIYSGCNIKGLMITQNNTGEHTLLTNVWYDTKKMEQSNQSHLMYLFLSLMYVNKLKLFLIYFPMYKKSFKHFRDQYDIFVNGLHKSYLSKYVYKYNAIITDKYLHHIDRIHRDIYIYSLNKGNATKITRGMVYTYVQELQPIQLFHLLLL